MSDASTTFCSEMSDRVRANRPQVQSTTNYCHLTPDRYAGSSGVSVKDTAS